jgi:hypothetical protein
VAVKKRKLTEVGFCRVGECSDMRYSSDRRRNYICSFHTFRFFTKILFFSHCAVLTDFSWGAARRTSVSQVQAYPRAVSTGHYIPLFGLEKVRNTCPSSEDSESGLQLQPDMTAASLLNLNSVNQLIFVMVKYGVLFEVRAEFLNNI